MYPGIASCKFHQLFLFTIRVHVKSIYSLMEVDVSHNKLTFVPSGLFKMPEIVVLNLSFNLLRTLPGDPEDQSATTPGGMV